MSSGIGSSSKQVSSVPPPPEDPSAANLKAWIDQGLDQVTTVLVVWQRVNPYANGAPFSPYKITEGVCRYVCVYVYVCSYR